MFFRTFFTSSSLNGLTTATTSFICPLLTIGRALAALTEHPSDGPPTRSAGRSSGRRDVTDHWAVGAGRRSEHSRGAVAFLDALESRRRDSGGDDAPE